MNKEKRGMFIPLSTERKIFLEDFLEQNCSFLIDKEFIEKLFNNFTQTEIEYLHQAIILPKESLATDLYNYNNSYPKDELRFINYLQHKYNQPRELILSRIRDIKRMYTYHQDLSSKKKRKNIFSRNK
ncbi:MAG: hypothetical protein ACI4VL_01760 [Bacilli bacterium]